MASLEITLFGSPMVVINGVPLTSRIDKGVALVAVLALQGSALLRDTIISQLWSESEMSKARAALRTAIWRLKSGGLVTWLEIEGEYISLKTNPDVYIDVVDFQNNLEKSRRHPHDPETSCPDCAPMLNRAVKLYRGDFMMGYSPRNAAGFDEWRTQHGHILKLDFQNALERLVKGYYQQGQYTQAIHLCRRWLTADPLNENAHDLMMRLYASNGQRANALTQYRTYKQLIDKSLGFHHLSEDITNTYQQILTGKGLTSYTPEPLLKPALALLLIDNMPELLIRHGQSIDQALARMVKIIKKNLFPCGGRIIQQSGDSYTIYVDRGQPLQCAIEIQKQIADIEWGSQFQLPLRMAIATLSQGHTNFPGQSPEMLICKHLVQAASGNQILLTEQAIRDLEFPLGSRARNLGSYIIPGQINPMQVYELVHKHLPNTGKLSLHNLVRAPGNLPALTSRFVGREEELARLAELLAQPERRLITLVGPGGVGKTRLGIQAVSLLEAGQPDGVYYIPLETHHNPATIFHPIAEGLNLSFNNPRDQATQLIELFRDKHILLLLDNFEHLLDAVPFLIKLLEAAPGLRLLITSRERLNLHTETIFDVHGLPYPDNPDDTDFEQYDGVKLFIQNAQRVAPSFKLQVQDKSSIIRICTLVEGLPLGIELSSSWVRSFSCQEIADSIQQNLDFLQTGSSDVPTRHRSLRAAFDHSWGLLSAEDQRVIVKLSIFNGGFSLNAAKALTNVTPIMLAAYIDKSIVSRQSNGRYFIPETIRSYLIEILRTQPLEFERMLENHGEYYLNYLISSLARFSSETGSSVIEYLRNNYANFSSAINWAIDRHKWSLLTNCIDPLMSYFELQGRFREGYDIAKIMITRITDLVGIQEPDIYYALLGWEGLFSFRLGFASQGLQKIRMRLEFAQSQGDFITQAAALMTLANAHNRINDLAAALAEIEQCLAIMEDAFDFTSSYLLSVYGHAQTIYGWILCKLDRYEDARKVLDQGQSTLASSGSRYGLIQLLDAQAELAKHNHDYEEALKLRLQALEIAKDFNDRRSMAVLTNNIGESFQYVNDQQSAIIYAERAAQISREIGDRQLCAISNNNLGYIVLQYHENPAEAIEYYNISLSMFRELNGIYGIFYTLRDISRAHILAGSITSARSHLYEALKLGDELNQPLLILHLLPISARLMAQLSRPERAIQLCRTCLNHPQANPDLKQESQSLLDQWTDQERLHKIDRQTDRPGNLITFQELITEISLLELQNHASNRI